MQKLRVCLFLQRNLSLKLLNLRLRWPRYLQQPRRNHRKKNRSCHWTPPKTRQNCQSNNP